MRRVTKEKILQLLKENPSITTREWDRREDLPSVGLVQKRFGSWNKAKRKAGLNPLKKSYTEEELLEYLRKNPNLKSGEWKEKSDLPGFYHFKKHFGSFRKAREKAGLRDLKKQYSDEELIELLKKNSELKVMEWGKREDLPSVSTIKRRFGSWSEAKKRYC